MENEKIICEAKIQPNYKKSVYYTIAFVLFSVGTKPIHYEVHDIKPYVMLKTKYRLFFVPFLERDDLYPIEDILSIKALIKGLLITIAAFVFLPLIFSKVTQWIANNCKLVLSEKGIDGQRKKLFSNAQLQLPIDKIDNIMISESIFDKLRGGKTVAIRSTSGLIKFPWVQNADEFVNATLAKIEEFKQSVKEENKNLVSVMAQNTSAKSDASAAAKIKELKELLDDGLISQEEFETKRKELLDKM